MEWDKEPPPHLHPLTTPPWFPGEEFGKVFPITIHKKTCRAYKNLIISYTHPSNMYSYQINYMKEGLVADIWSYTGRWATCSTYIVSCMLTASVDGGGNQGTHIWNNLPKFVQLRNSRAKIWPQVCLICSEPNLFCCLHASQSKALPFPNWSRAW